jgi:uncharacterized membrane protein YkvA (DUF1232 family)
LGKKLKAWADRLKNDLHALYLAARDPRVPWVAKLVVVAVAAYAVSPIDLIPDFIPVLGYLDDLVLLPLGIALAIKLIPPGIWADCKARAKVRSDVERPRSRAAVVVIVVVWAGVLAGLVWWGIGLRGG